MRTIAGLALLLLIGLMLGASMLVYSAYVLLAVFWICRSLSERWTTALTASRTISHLEAEVGGSVSVQLRLDNGSNLPVVWALVEDVLPAAALHGQASRGCGIRPSMPRACARLSSPVRPAARRCRR